VRKSSTKRKKRYKVWDRDKITMQVADDFIPCMWCSKQMGKHEWTLEHIIRKADGGTWDLSNLGAACGKCNNERHKGKEENDWGSRTGEHELGNGRKYKVADTGSPYEGGEYPKGGFIIHVWHHEDWAYITHSPDMECVKGFLKAAARLKPYIDKDLKKG
jgi:hypothetical protein